MSIVKCHLSDAAMDADSPDHQFEKKMTFGEHLEELRWCLLKALIGIAVCVLAALFFQRTLMDVIRRPHDLAFPVGEFGDSKLVAFSYQVPFLVHFKVALIFGVLAASPWVIFQLWKFVSAGLYPHERRYAVRLGFLSFGLFLAGVAFGYFLLIPYALLFLARLSQFYQVRLIPDIAAYVSLVMTLTIIVGVIFQVPLVMLFCVKVGLVDVKSFTSRRRHALIGAFIIGGILTPPDPITQPLLAIPLILLYEFGILLAKLGGRAKSGELRAKSGELRAKS